MLGQARHSFGLFLASERLPRAYRTLLPDVYDATLLISALLWYLQRIGWLARLLGISGETDKGLFAYLASALIEVVTAETPTENV